MSRVVRIDGLSPVEYAVQWGCDSAGDTWPNVKGDGEMFYAFAGHLTDVLWLTDFSDAIDRTIESLNASENFDEEEKRKHTRDLGRLLKYVLELWDKQLKPWPRPELSKPTRQLDRRTHEPPGWRLFSECLKDRHLRIGNGAGGKVEEQTRNWDNVGYDVTLGLHRWMAVAWRATQLPEYLLSFDPLALRIFAMDNGLDLGEVMQHYWLEWNEQGAEALRTKPRLSRRKKSRPPAWLACDRFKQAVDDALQQVYELENDDGEMDWGHFEVSQARDLLPPWIRHVLENTNSGFAYLKLDLGGEGLLKHAKKNGWMLAEKLRLAWEEHVGRNVAAPRRLDRRIKRKEEPLYVVRQREAAARGQAAYLQRSAKPRLDDQLLF